MLLKLLSTDDFRAAAKEGKVPDGTVFRFATTDPVVDQGGEDTRTVRFVFSDATVDHSYDTIDPKGWDLSVFNSNPVALFAHNSWDPPIGRAKNVEIKDGKLIGDIEFASAEIYPFADTIYRLVKGGFLKAVSVGFKPKEWTFSNDADRPYGIDFKKQTLLEISVCPVPCNPNALTEARSAGIETAPLREWAKKVLGSEETAAEPRFYVSVPGSFSGEQAKHVSDMVKRWKSDPNEVLIVPEGVTLRQIADVVADPNVTTVIPMDETKAGRKLSAATMAKLEEAMGYHDQMGACIRTLMAKDDEETDGINEVPGDDDGTTPDADDGLTPEPPGSTVVSSLTPEEQRLAEARALKASLTPNT